MNSEQLKEMKSLKYLGATFQKKGAALLKLASRPQ